MHSNLNANLMYPKDIVSFQEKLQEWKLILTKQTKFFVLDLDMFFLFDVNDHSKFQNIL